MRSLASSASSEVILNVAWGLSIHEEVLEYMVKIFELYDGKKHS
jgi:hypothetical protein